MVVGAEVEGMTGAVPHSLAGRRGPRESSGFARVVKWACVLVTVLFVGTFLVLPLVSLFYEAARPLTPPELRQAKKKELADTAAGQYWQALTNKNSINAMKMTLKVCA